MFYNHEILTSRKYGVATVWLVATLGSKPALKRVNKKAICNVDVPKACGVIMEPEAPMALRLQSNLLFGVARVYGQQCTYVLLDVEQLSVRMVQMLRSVHNAGNELDPQAGKTRPDKLLIPDDPNFLPDLAVGDINLDFDLDSEYMTADAGSSQMSSILSSTKSKSSRTSRGSSPSLRIPSSGSGGAGGIGDFGDYVSENGSLMQRNRLSNIAREAVAGFQDEGGILPEDDFAFDADGTMIVFDPPEATGAAHASASGQRIRATSETGSIEALVRQQHGDAALAHNQQGYGYEDNPLPMLDDNYNDLPPASRFDLQPVQPPLPREGALKPTSHTSTTSSSIVAPQRRGRGKPAKGLALDLSIELPSREFRLLQDNYLERMAAETKSKPTAALAKKNAEFYVWGQGVGGLGRDLRGTGLPDPLALFFGDKLRDAVFGIVREAGQKHDRDPASDEESERRVRRHTDEVDTVRGVGTNNEALFHEDEGLPTLMEEDEPEVGRFAPTPLPDDAADSTLMPWNLSASRHSSARPRIPSQSASRLPGPLRRLTSASPLHGHGTGVSSLSAGGDDLNSGGGWQDENDQAGPLPPGPVADGASQSEAHGPAAHVDTQTANSASWMRSTLDTEAGNFLTFVEQCASAESAEEPGNEGDRRTHYIFFESLLIPAANSKIVAAQAFLHCLSLATKGLMSVKQGNFGLRLGVKKTRIAKDDEYVADVVDQESESIVEDQ